MNAPLRIKGYRPAIGGVVTVSVPVVSITEARDRGLRWYFTGQACPRGHVAKRSVSNRECRHCVDAKRGLRRIEHTEKVRAKDREKYHRNPEHRRALLRANRAKHIEKRRAYDRARYRTPERRAYSIASSKLWWRKNDLNRGKFNYRVARRRAWIKQATPPWLTKEQRQQIRDFYIRAASLPGEWEVDHIYPLRAKNACGLNVPWNLQVILKADNRKKSNLMPGEERS